MRNRDVVSNWPKPLQPIGVILGYVPFARKYWRRYKPKIIVGNLLWRADDTWRRLRVSFTPGTRMQGVRELLEAATLPNTQETLISITLPSRKLGNRDNRIEMHLKSFTQMTEHPDRSEILVKVDEDDDLAFFYGIKRKFSGLKLRFFVTPRGAGYSDLSIYQSFLVDRASPTSQAWVCSWDDLIFSRKGWDLDVYDLIDQGTAFIAAATPFSTYISLMLLPAKPTPVPAYRGNSWPIISFSFLESLRSAADGLEGWTRLGDLYGVDGFFPAITCLFHEKYGINLYREIEEYLYQHPRAFDWTTSAKRLTMYYDAFTKFFEPTSMEIRSRVADTMYQEGHLKSGDESSPAAKLTY